jgi:capsule biosynthesis phosphatase
MNIVIPLGGLGTRFSVDGYKMPKPLISVLGKPMIFWVIDNLNIEPEDTLTIVYNSSLEHYRFKDLLQNRYSFVTLIKLEEATGGAAETLSLGLEHLNKSKKLISLDCDTFYEFDILRLCRESEHHTIFYFQDRGSKPIFSYITLEDGIVTDIKEKEKISKFASTGCYMFASAHEYAKYFTYTSPNSTETYISDVYRAMLSDVYKPKIIGKHVEAFHCVGTPLQLKLFCSAKSTTHNSRICFDLDNTLVTFPKIHGDYTTVDPITENIDLLRRLKNDGHTIIIHTARRMLTHNGNLGKVLADVAQLTFNTLRDFKIPFDEIYFGKPNADFYIDDKALNAFDNLEYGLGIYQTHVEERHFNTLSNGTLNTVIKQSEHSLRGEINWYRNIPIQIQDLFPKLIRSQGDHYYELERVSGIPLSFQLTAGVMTTECLDDVLDALQRIHLSSFEQQPGRHHYTEKLEDRSPLINDTSGLGGFYQSFMKEYENLDLHIPGIIHGDPVFGNILLTTDSLIFLDMRGVWQTYFTQTGDIFYDYAKVYQSLIGYDAILLDKPSTNSTALIKHFEDRVTKRFNANRVDWIKIIAGYLLFTLIPLHSDTRKCEKYYKLSAKIAADAPHLSTMIETTHTSPPILHPTT